MWAIKCYFIAQILAENRAVKTQVGRQKYYCQITAEILKFMRLCGKCQFMPKNPLWQRNEKSPVSTNFFPLVNFWIHS
jgi:hypothetical protein